MGQKLGINWLKRNGRFILSSCHDQNRCRSRYHSEQLTLGASNNDQLTEYFGRYEFKRWLNEVMNGADSITNNNERPTKIITIKLRLRSLKIMTMKTLPAIQIDRSRYETLITESDLNRWVDKLNQAQTFALDETDNLDYGCQLDGHFLCVRKR